MVIAIGWTRSGSPAKSVARNPSVRVIDWRARLIGTGAGASAAITVSTAAAESQTEYWNMAEVLAGSRKLVQFGAAEWNAFSQSPAEASQPCWRPFLPHSTYLAFTTHPAFT